MKRYLAFFSGLMIALFHHMCVCVLAWVCSVGVCVTEEERVTLCALRPALPNKSSVVFLWTPGGKSTLPV